MAYRLGELPYLGIADPVAKVTFPVFSNKHLEGHDVAAPYLTTLGLVALCATPLGVLLSATAGPLTAAAFGPKWLGMVGVLSVLGLWSAIKPLHATVGWLLNSVGYNELLGIVSALLLIVQIPALVVAALAAGPTGVAWVMTAHVVGALAICARLVDLRAGVSLGRQWAAVMPVVVASVAAWLAARGAIVIVESTWAVGAQLALAITAGGCVYFAVLLVIFPGSVHHSLARAGQMLRRRNNISA
jgi:O-antigen/teichoic acid export membrane protein